MPLAFKAKSRRGEFYEAAFSTDGGANPGNFTRFNHNGMGSAWQNSYGPGGGSKASVLYELDPTDGSVISGTYLIAKLSSGNTNTIQVTDLDWYNDQLVVYADSFFSPLRPDKTRMNHDGGPSPFKYRGIFSADLTSLNSAEAIGFDGVTSFSPIPEPSHAAFLAGFFLLFVSVFLRRRVR